MAAGFEMTATERSACRLQVGMEARGVLARRERPSIGGIGSGRVKTVATRPCGEWWHGKRRREEVAD
eukprot:1342633-Pleurochrysis_carterae.AAC.1